MSSIMSHPSLASMPLLDVVRLTRTLNVGSVTFFHLIQRFGTAADALEALPELSRRGGRKKPLIACPKNDAEKEIEKARLFGARMVVYGDVDYPEYLLTINDPPPLLTVLGHAQLWKAKTLVAMVGARNASANGCAFAGKLAKDLGARGITVVSGLARGIDTFAHKGSLATGTVGVVAGGIDQIYPPENKELFAQLRDQGAIISEQPFGMAPFSTSFPSRNRIIAGMSHATIVVEAAPKSGSLITARDALDYNREVFAVPGSPLDPRAKGCNQLIKQGATMIEDAEDVMQGLAHMNLKMLREAPAAPYLTQPNAENEAEIESARPKILEKLGATPVSVDELLAQCHVSPGAMLTVLLELELAGRLQRLPGNRVVLLLQEEMELDLVS